MTTPTEAGSADAISAQASLARTLNVNIAHHLTRMAETQPDGIALIHPGRGTLTYRELEQRSTQLARGLLRSGVGKGTRTALMVQPSLDLFTLVFGLFKAGAVPVLVDPGLGLRRVKACLERAEPEAFIGVAKAHVARALFGWAPSAKAAIHVGVPRWAAPLLRGGKRIERVFEAGAEAADGAHEAGVLPSVRPDDTAAILFTSGSTGPPKGAVYTHRNFAAQVEAIRALYSIQPGGVNLPTFPLFALFDPALGLTTVIPPMDPTRPARANAKRLADTIATHRVDLMFGSPALIDRLGRYGEATGARLADSLRLVISAGAPASPAALSRMQAMLTADASIVTPYGCTECLPIASIEHREILGETAAATEDGAGVCVGKPATGAEVRIIAIDDGPIASFSEATELPQPAASREGAPEWNRSVGEIVVRASQASRRYFREAKHDALSKMVDPDGRFWHRTGDLGRIDAHGRVWFVGRKSQRVESADAVYFTTACEGTLNAHPAVKRSALVGVRIAGETRPVFCVELEAERGKAPRAALVAELLAFVRSRPNIRAIDRILVHQGFPVDVRHNAKIGREALARWAEGVLQA